MYPPPGKKLTPGEARLKIEHYCAYQERCQSETREKLFTYGLTGTEVDEILHHLVVKGFLNEERFARAFAGGKFRQKQWGRSRIVRELKTRQISEYCIRKALQEIDDQDYLKSLLRVAEKYLAGLKSGSDFERRQKTIRYLMGRGFEYEECQAVLTDIL